ncbi:MAG TPA: hypothetical protein VFT91_09550 [Dehalococcoidia bacterium]|nr:hypothetical protein [Dehalococcoidia bacterium]
MIAFAIVAAFVLLVSAGAVVAPPPAGAQGADVQIVDLECAGSPEVVAVRNGGAEVQSLAGWRLESDAPSDGAFDLSAAGVLHPGETVFVQSGPGAGGLFLWGSQEVFRDGDASDFARIVDLTGAAVSQVSCAAGAGPPPLTPGAGVPNGGGAPAAAGGPLPAPAMMAAGALVAALGAMVAFLGWPRRAGAAAGWPVAAGDALTAGPWRRGDGDVSRPLALPVLLVLGFAVVVAALAFARRGHGH